MILRLRLMNNQEHYARMGAAAVLVGAAVYGVILIGMQL